MTSEIQTQLTEHRATIAKVAKRIETVRTVRMWEAGQRVLDREWAAIEALVGARVVSVPNDPSKPLCLGAAGQGQES